ncbi:MAG: hypothetical protein JSS11_14635 [Verrucomicrobia bacterium]|nr:hypothetical protein [Verrucomicrobiota bacterium]
MNDRAQATEPPTPRQARFAVLAVTLIVLAAGIAFVTWRLREGLRGEILRHEGDALAAVASLQLTNSEATLAELGVKDAPGALANAALQASRLRGVLAMRVFDARGKFADALPWMAPEDPVATADWQELSAGRAVTRLHPRETLTALTGLPVPATAAEAAVPVLEVWVPLMRTGGGKPAGAAQFWTDGRALAAEFAALDRRLAVQAGLAWLTGALLITLTLAWAFRRLAAADAALRARTADLERANRELTLLAKTSALGTVTAHLIHGLKSPLAGLEIFMKDLAPGGMPSGAGEEWRAASDLTRRLRRMVDGVVSVLRDDEAGVDYEMTSRELVELTAAKVDAAAEAAGVRVALSVIGEAPMPGRRANLTGLILQNLLQNAIEATPRGGTVKLTGLALAGGAVEFRVEDHAAGLPPAVRARLFEPCQSTKAEGSGLGLALSHQLAQQAGGRLELVRSDESGTCFRLQYKTA